MNNSKVDVNKMLGNNAKNKLFEDISESNQKKSSNKEEDIYQTIYAGKAMRREELLQFSLKVPVKMILIVGPFSSGKTTLMVMMYHLFREGLNHTLTFCGSKTMLGFWERSNELLLSSGNTKPNMKRTSTNVSDYFLHLEIRNKRKQVSNLIFMDIAGEDFEKENLMKDKLNYFSDFQHVILIMDGERIGNVLERRIVAMETDILITKLLKNKFVTLNTRLQVICTKMDYIKRQNNFGNTQKFVMDRFHVLKSKLDSHVAEISLDFVSALDLNDSEECRKLERIIEKCTETKIFRTEETEILKEESSRAFDWYGVR